MSFASMLKSLRRDGGLGQQVRRAGLATDLSAVAAVNIFQILGGDVLLTHIYGVVTTVIGNVGATTLQLRHTPTGGAATAMSAASAAINTDAANTIYTVTGAVAGAMAISAGLGVGVASFATNTQVLVPGIIDLNVGVSANTGVIEWTLHYVALEPNSRVIAL